MKPFLLPSNTKAECPCFAASPTRPRTAQTLCDTPVSAHAHDLAECQGDLPEATNKAGTGPLFAERIVSLRVPQGLEVRPLHAHDVVVDNSIADGSQEIPFAW